MKVVQRSPDLGIGVRLKPIVVVAPVAEAPVIPPVADDIAIMVSNASVSIYGPTLVHTVTLSRVFTESKVYPFFLVDITAVTGVDYVNPITNADLSDGVTIAGDEITVPAGVSTFTITVTTIFHPNGSFVTYEIRIGMHIVDVLGVSLGVGTIYDV